MEQLSLRERRHTEEPEKCGCRPAMDGRLLVVLILLTTLAAASCLLLISLVFSRTVHEANTAKQRRDIGNSSAEWKEPYPLLPDDYHASGLLLLPHSGIAEPFEIWFSGSLQISRIDYYYGNDRTFQRGDIAPHGKMLKYVPMYSDRQGAYEGCWTIQGTQQRPVLAQTMIPNITWFKYEMTEVYTGVLTTKWKYEYWAFGMLNSQTVWVTKHKPHRPIRYEMKGFDSMMGSYYDHYVFEYITFDQWTPEIPVFQLPRDIHCFNWSISMESSLTMNPMQEFAMFSPLSHINTDALYEEFKNSSHYYPKEEKFSVKRKHIFKHNMRFIRSTNRQNSSFKLAPNHFADLTEDEYLQHTGSIVEADHRNHAGAKELAKHKVKYVVKPPAYNEIPETLDWREYGAVTPVRGQGICGSCYAFTAVGVVEGAMFLKTGRLTELSVQQIMDCSWGLGNHGCKGGHYVPALSWIFSHGISTASSYGKYLSQEGACHFNDTWWGGGIDGFSYVQPWNDTALKLAIALHGPVAVSINVHPLSFKFYSQGIYDDSKCDPNATRHTAIVIGYGQENGIEYWLVKNSWSQLWGEHGYIRLAMKGSICGVTQYPVVGLSDRVTFKFPWKHTTETIVPFVPKETIRKTHIRHHRKRSKHLPLLKAARPAQGTKIATEVAKENVTFHLSPSSPSSTKGSSTKVGSSPEVKSQHKDLSIDEMTEAKPPKVNISSNKVKLRLLSGMTPDTIRWLQSLKEMNEEARKRGLFIQDTRATDFHLTEKPAQPRRRRRRRNRKQRKRKGNAATRVKLVHARAKVGQTELGHRRSPPSFASKTGDVNIARQIANSPRLASKYKSAKPYVDHYETRIHRIMDSSLNYLYNRIDKALEFAKKNKFLKHR